MSFVPAPQQANAANKDAVKTDPNAPPAEISDQDMIFKIRTFDVFWVEKHALMYKDGVSKVRKKIHLFYICCTHIYFADLR